MNYKKNQITAAIDATSAECFALHVLGVEFSTAVEVAMFLSHERDGNLTQEDRDLIASQMP